MPHSPYQKTVHAPINNLNNYEQALARHRASIENEERDKYRDDALLDIGQDLFNHCEFLEEKLQSKKDECSQFAKENTKLQQSIISLNSEIKSQKAEIASLKSGLEKLPAATKIKEQDGNTDVGETSEGSVDAAEHLKPRKRKR